MPNIDSTLQLSVESCFTPQETRRMDKHMTDTNRETGLDGTSIVDLGQNPSFGHGSPIVPTLTKSMRFWLMSEMALGQEELAS